MNPVWSEIRLPVFVEQEETSYAMTPQWSITGIYPKADGLVQVPDNYEMKGGFLDYLNRGRDTQACFPARRFWYFKDRHLDESRKLPDFLDEPAPKRPVSRKFGNTEKDIKELLRFRDDFILKNKLSDDPLELARAFADKLCYEHRVHGGHNNHPVDVIHSGAWCLGTEIAFCAIMRSLGIPARGSRCNFHATCEVLIDDQWRLVENSFDGKKPCDGDLVFPSDYVDLTIFPNDDIHGKGISDFQRATFYHFDSAHYGIPDGRWIEQSLVKYTPAFAKALYPMRQNHYFKTSDPHRLEIMNHSPDGRLFQRYDLATNLKPGESLSESVHLDDDPDLEKLEWRLHFDHIDGELPDEKALRDLRFEIQNQVFHFDQLSAKLVHDPLECPPWGGKLNATLTLNIDKHLIETPARVPLVIKNTSKRRLFRIPLVHQLAKPVTAQLLSA